MSKYAPPLDDGRKPYVVTSYHFGKESHSVIYGETAAEAKNKFRKFHGETRTARRATPDDLIKFNVDDES